MPRASAEVVAAKKTMALEMIKQGKTETEIQAAIEAKYKYGMTPTVLRALISDVNAGKEITIQAPPPKSSSSGSKRASAGDQSGKVAGPIQVGNGVDVPTRDFKTMDGKAYKLPAYLVDSYVAVTQGPNIPLMLESGFLPERNEAGDYVIRLPEGATTADKAVEGQWYSPINDHEKFGKLEVYRKETLSYRFVNGEGHAFSSRAGEWLVPIDNQWAENNLPTKPIENPRKEKLNRRLATTSFNILLESRDSKKGTYTYKVSRKDIGMAFPSCYPDPHKAMYKPGEEKVAPDRTLTITVKGIISDSTILGPDSQSTISLIAAAAKGEPIAATSEVGTDISVEA